MITEKTDFSQKLNAVAKRIGNTPLIPIHSIHQNTNVKIFAKAEWKQLSGSVKARAAFNIIKHAILENKLNENITLLDASSGNTGIAYATIAKELGLSVTLCIPANASQERKTILHALGAEIIYTSKFGGTDEAQEVADNLANQHPNKYFYANQYSNENNWKAHYYGTSKEIIEALPNLTHFVAGLGTTGTFVGTSRGLKNYNSAIKVNSLQPDLALHGLDGWKHLETAHIPSIYDATIADNNLEISTTEAFSTIKEFASKGLLLSPSSAANILGAIKLSNQIENGVIVTVLPDDASKYTEVLHQII